MQATIEPGYINGSITAPPSKSMTQRAYAAALLHKGTTIIHGAGNSADVQAALQIVQQLGAKFEDGRNLQGVRHLTSNGVEPIARIINCGESGLAARLFTPIAALSTQALKIDAAGSLLQRPMKGFKEVLPALGVQLTDFNGHLPLTIQGPVQARSIIMDASGGSQFLSGLLFALTDCATAPLTIDVKDLKSKPYIDMTLHVLEQFGRPVTHKDYTTFYIDPAKFTHKDVVEINIEADWSAAAFFLVAGAIAGECTVHGLDMNSTQADRAITDVLQLSGAAITLHDTSVSVKKSLLRSFEFDATHCPDLFPVLAILAACCNGESRITGIHRLLHKESNRAESIAEMLQNFDVPFSMEDDAFCINGTRKLSGTVIDTYNDHRIAMAAAVGALRARSRVDIMDAEAINKSYPAFFDDLILCGGKCKLAD